VAHQDDGREIHQRHPQIPAVLVPANVGGRLPPQSASDKSDRGSRKGAVAG
jgi:hypothetical protein